VGLFEGLFGAIALVAHALEFFSQVAILFGSVFGLLFPLLSAASEFGLLAHLVPPGQGLSPRALDAHGTRLTRIAKLKWPCTTKANGDRDRNGNLVARSTFWVRKSTLFGRFWTTYALPDGSIIYADRAYNDYEIEDLLKEVDHIRLVPMRKKNSTRALPPYVSFVQHYHRKRIETAGSLIEQLLPKSIHAVTPQGFELKVALFVIAHSVSCYINS
jgi:hypothetical protein